jgi:phosphoribosylformimino-5-aminoimidazole carboxamide ribotide isomerase
MQFRPCIDIHNGCVKQIVGSTLSDVTSKDVPTENFATQKPARDFAALYAADELTGGHIIMLDNRGADNASFLSALSALREAPGTMQVGGGINAQNAHEFLEAGASHVIVTSSVFNNGSIDYDMLSKLVNEVGKDRLVLDISCRRRPDEPGGQFFVVTNKYVTLNWFSFT